MRSMLLSAAACVLPMTAAAQSPTDSAAVLAVVDSALARISRNDMAGSAALMISEGISYRVATSGDPLRYRVTTRAQDSSEVAPQRFLERGFDAEVRIAGRLAMVWLPYDFHLDGKWSHCGVDLITLIKVGDQWRLATFGWTVEQPPACKPHPDGPPR